MDVTLKKFYNLFWSNKVCRNIFLTHKEILLEKNPVPIDLIDYYLPRIVLSNSLKQKKGLTKINARLENFGIELLEDIKLAKEQYLGEDRVEELIDRRFSRAKYLILEEHGDDWFFNLLGEIFGSVQEEETLIKLLQKYGLIPIEVSSFNDLAKRFELEIVEEIKKYLKAEDMNSILSAVDNLTEFYNSLMKEALLESNQHITSVLVDVEDFKSRLEVFDNLYEMGILVGGKYKAFIECTRCTIGTYSGLFKCRIEPSKLKFKCPNCGKDAYYLVPYQINQKLYEQITHPDGLLFFAVEYLLDKYDIEYKVNTTIENSNEIDILLLKEEKIAGFLEVKMFKNHRAFDVKVKNLLSTVNQVKKNREKLREVNADFDKLPYIIVSNYSENDVYEESKEQASTDLKDENILILSGEQLLNRIKG